MAKTQKKILKQEVKPSFDLTPVIEKYFWLVIPVLTLAYYYTSRIALGFYQDDEISQYINMLNFWKDPAVILGNNPKPGYKIFMVLPALVSYDFVLIVNAFIASLAVFYTYKLLKVYEIPYAYFGALLLASQPLFVDLSFRSYSEIFTSLCIVLFLILYKKEKFVFAALLSGYIFTIRQEIAVFCLVLGVIFFLNKKYKEIIIIGIFPVLYNLLGYMKTGDLFYIFTEIKTVSALIYNSQGVMHYFKVYIFIVGPVTLALFLLGFFGFLADTKKMKEYFNKYILFYILFVTIFAVQIYTMWSNGPNPGNWRYLLHISPVAVFFATVGLNHLVNPKYKNIFYILTGSLAFLTFIFLSKTTDGFILQETSDYTKVIFLIIFFVVTFLISKKNPQDYLNKASVLIILLSIVYLYVSYAPKKLSPENITMKTATEFLDSQDITGKYIYSNHSLLFFYSKYYRANQERFNSINAKNISEAPAGSLVFWENHYGYRPEWKSDVKVEDLQSNPNFKLIKQIPSSDKRFTVAIFEKIN